MPALDDVAGDTTVTTPAARPDDADTSRPDADEAHPDDAAEARPEDAAARSTRRLPMPSPAAAAAWAPAALLAVATTLVLWFYGVSPATTAVFAVYLLLAVVVPGTLVWRALHRGRGWFVAEVAAGTILGYAVEVLAYIPARALGLPLLVLCWPVATVAVFTAVPRLRRFWRTAPDAVRTPPAWRWALAGCVALAVVWSVKFFRRYGLSWPGYSTPDTDSTFHLALLGEARHHMPMMTPWTTDQPLLYHWFVYAGGAAPGGGTGIEARILLLRLSPLAMLVAFVVGLAVLAKRLFTPWWASIVAVVITLFVLAPNPYQWQLTDFITNLAFNTLDDGSSLRLTVWTGPTQTFGALLFVGVMLLLVDLFRQRGHLVGRSVLLGVLLVAVSGAKATYLPVLLAGLLTVIVGHLVVRRRLHRPALAATGAVVACLAFAQLVLFGGSDAGLRWQPLQSMVTSGISLTTGFAYAGPPDTRRLRLGLLACLAAWCWLCVWGGIGGLLRRRPAADGDDGGAGAAARPVPLVLRWYRALARMWLFDPEMLLLLGIGAAGIGATSLLGQSGDSQRFFFESARPYLSLAAAGGLVAILGSRRLTQRAWLALGASVLVGMLVVRGIQALGPISAPGPSTHPGWKRLGFAIAWPYLLMVVVAAVLALGLALARRRVPALRGLCWAMVVALLAGFGISTAYGNYAKIFFDSRDTGWREVVAGTSLVPEGTLEAGRWLREHSSPDDLVATNAHCLVNWPDKPPTMPNACVNLHFSLSAYTERRVLVEGWGFTSKSHEEAARLTTWVGWVPYWRPEVLAANDAVFLTPSAAAVGVLRDRYRVRWLVADATQGAVSPRLADFATLRYRSGTQTVYELR